MGISYREMADFGFRAHKTVKWSKIGGQVATRRTTVTVNGLTARTLRTGAMSIESWTRPISEFGECAWLPTIFRRRWQATLILSILLDIDFPM